MQLFHLRDSETKISDFSDHIFFCPSIYLLIWIRKDGVFCKSLIPAHLMGTFSWTEMVVQCCLNCLNLFEKSWGQEIFRIKSGSKEQKFYYL